VPGQQGVAEVEQRRLAVADHVHQAGVRGAQTALGEVAHEPQLVLRATA
jgi:hypothetical protein